MLKKSNKSTKRDPETAIRAKRTADIVGVSLTTVYRVIIGDPRISKETADKVMIIYMELKDGENQLIEAVKQLVPFEQ
jgi:hypothetical protein